jgi:hypothetical protein
VSVTFRSVRAVLWRDWDPIGAGVPEDEYDDYVPPVMAMLNQGKGRADVAAYLRMTAAETIGCPVTEDKLAGVVEKLFALKGDAP